MVKGLHDKAVKPDEFKGVSQDVLTLLTCQDFSLCYGVLLVFRICKHNLYRSASLMVCLGFFYFPVMYCSRFNITLSTALTHNPCYYN